MSSIIRRVNDEKITGSSCLPRGVNIYATYIIEWCHGFAITSRIVYEEDKLPKIPYKWVTKNTEDKVYRHVVKPHLHPLNNHIFYLMKFMRYYDGKYTHKTWNHLYTQYLHKYWVTYHCFKLWCNLSWLRTLKKISRMNE